MLFRSFCSSTEASFSTFILTQTIFVVIFSVLKDVAFIAIVSLLQTCTTLSNGCLGFRIDDERSKLRLLLRIAELSESSNLRTHLAPSSSSECGCAHPSQFHLHLSHLCVCNNNSDVDNEYSRCLSVLL